MPAHYPRSWRSGGRGALGQRFDYRGGPPVIDRVMPLQIALDTRRIADFGIGTYIRNLVRALARVDSANQYTLITTEQPVPEFSDLPSNFRTAIFPGQTRTGLAQV